MKPIYQKLTTESDEGFVFKAIQGVSFDCPFHAHPEYELILVLRSNGYRIVGDNFSILGAGDLVFVGPGLPHIWQNETRSGRLGHIGALLIQFEEKIFSPELLKATAMEPIRHLLKSANRGLHIVGHTRERVTALMKEMATLEGMSRFIQLLQILDSLAQHVEDSCPIASVGFSICSQPHEHDRMDRVLQFLNKHLEEEIRLSEVAKVIHLSESAFSRFFRAHTGKTFPELLNQLRIGRACHLLADSEMNVTEVGFACGFSSVSNFNLQFRKMKGQSPTEYRKQMHRTLSPPSVSSVFPR